MEQQPAEPIALVGIGCRFPGADGPEAYWRLLREGRDAITEVPTGRWGADDFYHPDPATPGKTNSRWGGFLDQVDGFDYPFFGLSAEEAAAMDPQQRLLLEVAWEALEDAGQVPAKLAASQTGVFAGIMHFDYGHLHLGRRDQIGPLTGPGMSLSIAANRLSYLLDLRGPSMAIDTACSSSLVATHLACASLRRGECDLALAGGVSLLLSAAGHIFFTKAGVMSPDGCCRVLDASANGVVRGEGAGVVVLKTLPRALADGDRIYAQILGGAVNHDGASNGLMAPSRLAQEALLRSACREAAVPASRVSYVELHGTGTPMGDPIEATAVGKVMATGRDDGSRCAVGSVKSNLGHLEAAAGVAGLIKVALMLRRQELVPSLHFKAPNPRIPFDRLPIEVQRATSPWSRIDGGLVAGVSSFGFGGTNAHLILGAAPPASLSTEAPTTETLDATRAVSARPQLLTLSARSEAALQAAATRWAVALEEVTLDQLPKTDTSLADLCYTASVRRGHSAHRLAAVGRDASSLARRLSAFARDGNRDGLVVGRRPPRGGRAIFVFCGQGSQRPGMGAELMAEPAFRLVIERCQRHFAEHVSWSLWDEIVAPEEFSRLDHTEIAQPALFAVQIALAALWRSWGVEPAGVIGHSLGEIAAAHVAGALSLKESIRIVLERSRLMQSATGQGQMAAVTLSASQASKALEDQAGRLGIAAINGPASTVLSGQSEPLRQMLDKLEDLGASHRMLEVDYAFHSPQMSGLAEGLRTSLGGLQPRSTELPLWSTVTGERAAGDSLTAGHWARQLAQPVRFADALAAALAEAPEAVLEISPHPVLASDIDACLEPGAAVSILPSLRRGFDDRASLLSSLGALYAGGADVDWEALHPTGGRLVRLPSYPWQRRRCWLSDDPSSTPSPQPDRRASGPPLLRGHTRLIEPAGAHLWDFELDREALAYLDDHQIEGSIVMPGAVYIEMALAAAVTVFGQPDVEASEIRLSKALFMPVEGSVRLQLVLKPVDGETLSFHLASLASGSSEREPTLHATGNLRRLEAGIDRESSVEALSRARGRCRHEMDPPQHYRSLKNHRFDYGESFQTVRRLRRGDREALARIQLSASLRPDSSDYQIHPALLDTAFQVLMAAGELPPELADSVFLPTEIDRVRLHGPLGEGGWNHSRLHSVGPRGPHGDARFYGHDGALAIELLGLKSQRIDHQPSTVDSLEDHLYQVTWVDQGSAAAVAHDATQPLASWLLLADSSGVAEGIAAELRSRGEVVNIVLSSEPLEPALARASTHPATVVDLRGLDPSRVADPGEQATALCAAALESLQFLARRHHPHQPPRLWWVTAGACGVAGDAIERAAVSSAALWGLSRTVSHEHPDLWGGIIDLPADASPSDSAAWLVSSLRRNDGEDQIAVRGGRRLVARLARPRQPELQSRSYKPRHDACYLITGGLGGLGLTVARWLVDNGARHLVLVSRSADSPDNKTAIRQLEERGARLRIAAVDVADEDRMRSLMRSLEAEGRPALRGVFHAAGVAHEQPLLDTESEALRAQLRAKVAGGWLLHRLVEAADLDFFVLFSSIASLLPPHAAGLAGYAAGNSFLDALAHHRRSRGLPALSVNWGPWSDVGLAAARRERLESQGLGYLSPEQGITALGRLLGQQPTPDSSPQVAVAAIDWRRWRRAHRMASEAPLVRALARPEDRRAHRGQPTGTAPCSDELRQCWISADPKTRRELVGIFLEQLISSRLPLAEDGLDPTLPLVDLGLDSLAAAEVRNQVTVQAGLDLPVTLLLGGASLAELTEWAFEKLEESSESGGTSAADTESGGTSADASESGGTSTTSTPTTSEASYARADYDRRSWLSRLTQRLFRLLIGLAAKVDARGGERLPDHGPLIIAYNHPSKLDKIGLIAYPSRRCVLLAAGYARYRPRLRRLLNLAVETIFIDRGAGDLQALDQALAVLAAGGALSMSPEGEISDDGSLKPAKTGVAFLASKAQARVLPVAAWGHENAPASWRKLRRAPVSLRVGQPLPSPPAQATPGELEDYTERVMRALAELLPSGYRGVYASD